MIDIHCHILPSIDDGAADDTESLKMAREAVRQGIDTIIATPHHVKYRYDTGPTYGQRSGQHVKQTFE